MKYFGMLLVAILILFMVNPAMAAEPQKVIGKLTVAPGATVVLMAPDGQGDIAMVPVASAKTQTFYIIDVIESPRGMVYVADATDTGFWFNCQQHGPEHIKDVPMLLVGVPKISVDGKLIKVKLFE